MTNKLQYLILVLFILISCKKEDKPQYAIFAWGDSFTAGLNSTDNYPNYLQQMVSKPIANMGIGGATSTQIADRMLSYKAYAGRPAIIWAGRNNYRDTAQVQADIARMVGGLTTTHYLVLGILNRYKEIELKDGADYKLIVALNKSLQAKYAEHFIDIRQYLVDQYDITIEEDVRDHGLDIAPSSLRSDILHLNAKGYKLVADKIYSNIGLITE